MLLISSHTISCGATPQEFRFDISERIAEVKYLVITSGASNIGSVYFGVKSGTGIEIIPPGTPAVLAQRGANNTNAGAKMQPDNIGVLKGRSAVVIQAYSHTLNADFTVNFFG